MTTKAKKSEPEEPEEVEAAVSKPEEKPKPEGCTCREVERAGLKMPCPSCIAKGLGAFEERR